MTKLPVNEKETVVDVNLKHLFFAFGGLVTTAFTVSVGVVVIRDYAKYKRQKAIIEAATHLLLIIQNPEGSNQWKEPKQKKVIPSSSQMKK